MSPAQYVIQAFGGVRPLARALAPYIERDFLDPSTIARWGYPRPRGCDGLIPAHYHQALLALARDTGVPVTAEHLVYGLPEGEAA